MIYNKFHTNIIIRVILLALNSLFIFWYFYGRGIDLTFFFAIAVFIIQTINLIVYTNKTNKLLSFFFDAVKNEDSTLVFNEKAGSTSFNLLSKSLNLLNKKIQDAKIEITVQEKYYKTIVESAASAILVFDETGSVELSNSAMNNLLGLSNFHNINQLDRISRRFKDVLLEIEEGESLTINVQFNDVPFYLYLSSVSMTLKERKVKLVALQDISYEIDRQEIESWQRLIRILNHEIMNSVAPITSLSSTLSGFFRKDEINISPAEINEKTIANTIKGLTVIEEHGKGLISFVESYRSLTKLPRPKPEEIMVSELFDSLSVLASSYIETQKEKTGHSVDIMFQANPRTLVLFADKELITRAIYNLIKNAIEALGNETDGVVFLESGKDKSGNVWIKIIDNGPGIGDDIIDNIFVPFFTTKEGGSGIGLSLAKQIVNMHKGTLSVFSNPGEGTTINIRFLVSHTLTR
jgi:nitrogen fixation/metabolism regulation signal transduction histidine kinase